MNSPFARSTSREQANDTATALQITTRGTLDTTLTTSLFLEKAFLDFRKDLRREWARLTEGGVRVLVLRPDWRNDAHKSNVSAARRERVRHQEQLPTVLARGHAP